MKRYKSAIIGLLVTASVAMAYIQLDDTNVQTILSGAIKTFAGAIRFQATGGGSLYVGVVAPAVVNTPSVTYKLPQNDGASGQALTTDGSANLSFATTSRNGSVWIALGECQNSTPGILTDVPASGATPGPVSAACASGTNTVKGELTYSSGANLQSQVHYYLPLSNTAGIGGFNPSGTTTANIIWTSTTTSGNVVWNLATSCVSPGSTDDPAFTSNNVTTAAPGSSGQLKTSTVTLSVGSCLAGDLLHLRLSRSAGTGSDTMAGDALAIGIELNVARL